MPKIDMAKFARKKRSAIALQSAESIDYRVTMRANPLNDNDPERAYPTLQYAGTVKLEQLASHITTHGSLPQKICEIRNRN